jgi:hypothetical protein
LASGVQSVDLILDAQLLALQFGNRGVVRMRTAVFVFDFGFKVGMLVPKSGQTILNAHHEPPPVMTRDDDAILEQAVRAQKAQYFSGVFIWLSIAPYAASRQGG